MIPQPPQTNQPGAAVRCHRCRCSAGGTPAEAARHRPGAGGRSTLVLLLPSLRCLSPCTAGCTSCFAGSALGTLDMKQPPAIPFAWRGGLVLARLQHVSASVVVDRAWKASDDRCLHAFQ